MSTRTIVIGAGGQGRETAWVIRAMKESGCDIEFVGFVVTDLKQLPSLGYRSEVLGDYDWLRKNRTRFNALSVGIGTPEARRAVMRNLSSEFPSDFWPPLIHPAAQFDRSTCELGRGVLVSAGAIVTVGVTLGSFSMVNFGATLGHEVRVGEGTVINPGANVSGGVVLGDGVLVGTGAQILQYIEVGSGATIGAGAVVTKNVAAGETVIGIPARAMRKN